MYARSYDAGDTFTTPVSVSRGVSYYLLSVTGTAFSTLDLEVESGGNPHVTFAFVSTADRQRKRNVYYTRSADGGSTWDTPKIVNDHNTVGNLEGRRAAFPRMAIDDRDNIFISYVRGTSRGTGTGDIMLAKVNRSNFGITAIGETGITALGFTFTWATELRIVVMSSVAHALKLLDGQEGRRHRLFFWALMLAVLVSMLSSLWTILDLSYRYGGINLNDWLFGPSGAPVLPFKFVTRELFEPDGPDIAGWVSTTIGGGVMGLLMLARQQIFWWPLHPLGFVISTSSLTNGISFSVFLSLIHI